MANRLESHQAAEIRIRTALTGAHCLRFTTSSLQIRTWLLMRSGQNQYALPVPMPGRNQEALKTASVVERTSCRGKLTDMGFQGCVCQVAMMQEHSVTEGPLFVF